MNKIAMLLRGALGMSVPAEFSVENYDYETALRDELNKLAGSKKDFRRNKYDIFDLLAEAVDEILPQNLASSFGAFSEIRQFNNGDRMDFVAPRGKMRAKQFVTRSTAAGAYETFRLDRQVFEIYPVAIGGAGYVDFDRYLHSSESIADVFDVIYEGMADRIFEMVQDVLCRSWNAAGRPAANKLTMTSFDVAAMTNLCNTIAAYGSPVIYCSPQFAATMNNAITYSSVTKIADEDLTDVRERGFVGRFHGFPVVVLPQSFLDEDNAKFAINPCVAYVIPTGKEKIVKIGMEGDAYFDEQNHPDYSIAIRGYKKVGVGLASNCNFWGIAYNTAITAGGWTAYNQEVFGA